VVILGAYDNTFCVYCINETEGCHDRDSKKCQVWKNETWFEEWCKGRHKDDNAKGYFGGKTLMETCKKSCDGCNG